MTPAPSPYRLELYRTAEVVCSHCGHAARKPIDLLWSETFEQQAKPLVDRVSIATRMMDDFHLHTGDNLALFERPLDTALPSRCLSEIVVNGSVYALPPVSVPDFQHEDAVARRLERRDSLRTRLLAISAMLFMVVLLSIVGCSRAPERPQPCDPGYQTPEEEGAR